jgi:hypothetical protein
MHGLIKPGKSLVSAAHEVALVLGGFGTVPNRGRNKAQMSRYAQLTPEFDMVVVLWPAAMTGNVGQKRRLLYNAVTRARSRCLVLVQAQAALMQPPFT